MLKEILWREINSLPKSQLQTLLDFTQFLQFMEQQKNKTETASPRIPGLDVGTTWVSDDFDDPLPESFWFGDTANYETVT